MKRVIFGLMLALLTVGMMPWAFNIKTAKGTWIGTVYIRVDGSIDPPEAPIIRFDNVTYTLNDTIAVPDYNYGVVVQRDNIVIDGMGYTLQGSQSGGGFSLSGRNNVTIKNANIENVQVGISLDFSSSISIIRNNITNNDYGIQTQGSSNNNIIGNHIINNGDGILLSGSSNGNNISGNVFFSSGLRVMDSYGNIVVDNWVNGKPLMYLENVSDFEVEDAGQVILVNCVNITVKGLDLSNTTVGIQSLSTNNTSISGNNITNNSDGIMISSSSDINISENNITANNWSGISLAGSSNININGNNIKSSGYGGIVLGSSSNIDISGNNITNSECGLCLDYSLDNSIYENSIVNNDVGIKLRSSSNNTFYNNNFINNARHVYDELLDPWSPPSINIWDDGYPSGGNYWSNYTGVDFQSGSYQNETGSDGIGDSPHVIDENNQDNYPLMGMFYDYEVVGFYNETYHVQVISNSTVSMLGLAVCLDSLNEYLQPGQEFLLFYVEGETDTSGFCRVTIPRALLNDSYIVLVDWTEVPTRQLDASNSAHAYLYFTYNHTKHEVAIIPEFPSTITLPCLMLTNLIATLPLKKKLKNKTQTS
jgi:parallel beta-helix repeat protein